MKDFIGGNLWLPATQRTDLCVLADMAQMSQSNKMFQKYRTGPDLSQEMGGGPMQLAWMVFASDVCGSWQMQDTVKRGW